MCVSLNWNSLMGKGGRAKPTKYTAVEPMKSYDSVANDANASKARAQQLRSGLMSTFNRGYGAEAYGQSQNGTQEKLGV